METIQIELPWPHKTLNPNSRAHWGTKNNHKKKLRHYAYIQTKSGKHLIPGQGKVFLKIVIHPPDKRKRDLDNISASLKSAFDGIADALGIDDMRFVPIPYWESGDVIKHGRINIYINDNFSKLFQKEINE